MIYLTLTILAIAIIIPMSQAYIKRDLSNLNLLFKIFVDTIVILTSLYLILRFSFHHNLFSTNLFNLSFMWKFVLLTASILIIWKLFIRILKLNHFFKIISVEPFSIKRLLQSFFLGLFFALTIFIYLGSYWTTSNFGLLNPEQVIYNLQQPMTGANQSFLLSFLNGPLLQTLVILIMTIPVLLIFFSIQFNFSLKHFWYKKIATSLILIGGIILGVAGAINLNVKGFYQYFTSSSTFIKNHYIDPNQTKLTFPKKKRNLIYIYVESLESTSIDKAQGGQMDVNLLPKLTALAEDKSSIHFSDSNKEFGGAYQFYGTNWTIAGMVNQTAGIPLKVPGQHNKYANEGEKFLPGITTLNDILAKEGYQQTILMGSDATFGGRRSYFTQHGNVTIDDYLQAKKDGRIPKDYKVWWGYEDSKLFEFAKQDITKLATNEKPFNFTMLTANTHHIGGYMEKDMPKPYDHQYSDVIAFTDTQLAEFITWLQQQDFYDNTTVIVQGDHLSMDPNYFKELKVADDKRRTFNLILNAPMDKGSVKTKNRDFGTFDLFPTTLAALNVEITGNRLGLGTNLFSNKETLAEQYGNAKIDNEFSQSSKFYNDTFVYDQH